MRFRAPCPRLGRSTVPRAERFLRAARTALLAGPVAAVGYGTFVARFRLSLREVNIPIPGLPKDLDGLRIVQLTDIHLSPFLSLRELERAVEMANETRAHVALVTGDLISTANDPLDDCLNALARLRADAGVFGCMGNHEIYADSEAYTQMQGRAAGHALSAPAVGGIEIRRRGPQFCGRRLSALPQTLPGGRGAAGCTGRVQRSYCRITRTFSPWRRGRDFHSPSPAILTEGRCALKSCGQDLNVARFFTPYVDGVYRSGGSSIFVSRGIGTIGLPARLGAPPEVALIRLCRT